MATEAADDPLSDWPRWGLDSAALVQLLSLSPAAVAVQEPRTSPTQRAFLETVTLSILSPSAFSLDYGKEIPKAARSALRRGYDLARCALGTVEISLVRNRGPAYGAEEGERLYVYFHIAFRGDWSTIEPRMSSELKSWLRDRVAPDPPADDLPFERLGLAGLVCAAWEHDRFFPQYVIRQQRKQERRKTVQPPST